MSTTECDVVVVGMGAMGSATTAHLARRGYDVVGLERYDVAHSRGSSHGITRIIRLPQYEGSSYVPLVRRAMELWQSLDATYRRPLLQQVGSVDLAAEQDDSLYSTARQSCTAHDIDHEVLTGAELNDRVGGFDVPAEYRALYQPDGGFLHCEQCLVAYVERALRHGATVRARETVESWADDESGVTVRTDRDTYHAETLVVTAGAWTGQLLPSLSHLLEPERQVVGWFQPTEPDRFAPETFPVFVADVPEGHFYGFPAYEIPGFKIGKFNHRGETGTPAELAREPDRQDERLLREFTGRYVLGADGPTMRLSTCMFTNTPDEDFILDVHPDAGNVVVGAGFSGHGFKFAPAIGEVLADLAVESATTSPTAQFRLDRFE